MCRSQGDAKGEVFPFRSAGESLDLYYFYAKDVRKKNRNWKEIIRKKRYMYNKLEEEVKS